MDNHQDRKSTRLNSSHLEISYAVFCLKKKTSGASKWNPIEHRVFSQISSNWAGYPLRSLRRILGFIRGTSTETGLTVDADVDPRAYEKGIKISDQEMRTLNLTCRRLCPNLNYTIRFFFFKNR